MNMKKLMQISVSVDLPSSARMWVYTCAICECLHNSDAEIKA